MTVFFSVYVNEIDTSVGSMYGYLCVRFRMLDNFCSKSRVFETSRGSGGVLERLCHI